MNRIVYLCEDTPDGIFTAIYDAWAARIPDEQLSIRVQNNYMMEFFTDYVEVQTDLEKAVKVARSVNRKIGTDAYDMIYKTALSCEEEKIDVIYRFLKLGFSYGHSVVAMHADDRVCRLFEYSRAVTNEAHLFREFVRFGESDEGILISRIKPKNQVLPLIAYHFSDRFPEEDFVILDETHRMGLFHAKGQTAYLSPLTQEALDNIWKHNQGQMYEDLWRTFFRTIAIQERTNKQCQRNHCALRYRDYMVEFHR